MTDDVIAGICRFSFLGVGDWAAFRDKRNAAPERLQKIAEYLYDEDRMTTRFKVFQNICLPSILAQTDPRFIFIVLSSTRMPEHWRNRLIDICKPHDQIELLWSDIPDTNNALDEKLKELHDLSNGRLWQFRLDDDDAMDIKSIERLRSHIPRMEGYQNCAISVARGMYVALYEGQETEFLEYETPFHGAGAGAAVKLSEAGRSIFSFPHFKIRDRLTNFVDFEAFGALILKWPSDSSRMNLDQLPVRVNRMEKFAAEKKIRNNFPFLTDFDFDSLRLTPSFPQKRMKDYLAGDD